MAKFHYAVQVADPVSDQVTVSDKFVRVCDNLATFWVESRSQTGSNYVDMSR